MVVHKIPEETLKNFKISSQRYIIEIYLAKIKMKRYFYHLSVLALTILFVYIFSPDVVLAQFDTTLPSSEQIHNYDSIILLRDDGTLDVKEVIEVTALGQEIQRGIYRDFPTNYQNNFGFSMNTTFDVQEVLKNGEPEPYFTERQLNGIRLYIGSENVFIPDGRYTYSIEYRTKNQISYNEDHDRLLYNVTGSGWTFPILKSTARVVLPKKVDHSFISAVGYTGEVGSSESSDIDVKIEDIDGKTVILFTNQNEVLSGMDFTIDLRIPKRTITEPTGTGLLITMLKDNFSVIFFVFSSIILFVISMILWYLKGRDPSSKSVYPQFEIPENISPGVARYVMRMGYDNTILTSVIASLGSKGHLKVTESEGSGLIKKKKNYTITKVNDSKEPLTSDEQKFMDEFFKNDRDSITFGDAYSAHIESASASFMNFFDREIRSSYFSHNLKLSSPIIVFTLVNFGIFAFLQYTMNRTMDLVTTIVIFGWGIIVSIMGFLLYNRYQSRIRLGLFSCVSFLVLAIVVFAFISFSPVGLFNLALIVPASIITAFTAIFTYFALKARTVEGKQLENNLLGLKMFINAAEDEKIKIMNKAFPKDMNTFNKYFPYALAFGLELKWAEQFKDVIKAAQMNNTDQGYNLGWYYGVGSFNSNSFSNSMSDSLVSSIASSATPPSSSGSGGGFSGGGGGGGGGGGW